jgi:hypothetical protein
LFAPTDENQMWVRISIVGDEKLKIKTKVKKGRKQIKIFWKSEERKNVSVRFIQFVWLSACLCVLRAFALKDLSEMLHLA